MGLSTICCWLIKSINPKTTISIVTSWKGKVIDVAKYRCTKYYDALSKSYLLFCVVQWFNKLWYLDLEEQDQKYMVWQPLKLFYQIYIAVLQKTKE